MQYRHFKGGIYDIICEATLESDPTVTMIVYRAANGSIWTRPSSVFFEQVECDGKMTQRFVPLGGTIAAEDAEVVASKK